MMKKNGFTLAEVLITLAIIGVVATLTLPSLLTNTQEQQALTAFKKIMNTLNEAGQMNAAMEGFDYSISSVLGDAEDCTSARISEENESLCSLFNERLQVSVQASGGYGEQGEGDNGNKCTGDNVLVLRDGTAICLVNNAKQNNGDYWEIYVDTNGPKGPNEVSTCGEEGCITKAERLIKDQFPVTLSRGIAVPGKWSAFDTEDENDHQSFAARYAMGVGRRERANNAGGGNG